MVFRRARKDHGVPEDKTIEHTAYPIFYDVEPTEVRNQSGAVGKAFAKHVRGSWSFVVLLSSIFSFLEACCNGFSCVLDLEKEDNVGRWRDALKEAASLTGMELKNTFNGDEAKYIQQIVEEVSRKLQFFNLSVDGKLVGRETQVIGVQGIGGDGETTLARNICDHTSIRLEGESFVEDIREISKGSVGKRFKYHVFLSFRGEDTRKTFVDHLYLALNQRGIITYKDDEKIKKGKRIDDQLITSIEDSRFHIIVFSKNYASSSWCLEELVKIMECQKTTGQTAYPVFYDVEPTEVRHQSGAVDEAFKKHVEKEGACIWRNALKEAADLVGWELKNTVDGHEAKFIQKIVEYVSLELRFIDTSVDGKLVGMATRVENILSSLEIGCNDVRILGIKGMGGGGKTTLARAVYDHISNEFEGVADGESMIKKRLVKIKVLLVLDDVDDIGQLQALAGAPTWFGLGSRIIITTRDEQVLKAHRMKFIHDVNLLSHEEGICLFNKYAFGREIPIEGYKELSGKVVRYAAGLPLTIKVLGSSLCGKTVCEWNDAIERLKSIPEKQTLKRLELSYIGLEDDHKEVFLEVACILKGESKYRAISILETCGFHARFALKVLEQKSLITVSYFGYLHMHDRIEEMGRDIVRRSHPHEPQRHNRLWVKEEIENILANELGTEATLSIKLMFIDLHPAIIMKGLRKMKKLRVLYVRGQNLYSIQFPENKLEMGCSNISQPWEGGDQKVLNELKFLDLGLTPQVEILDLKFFNQLEKFHMFFKNPKLKYLCLGCSWLRKLDLRLTPQLETLNLKECVGLVELHLPIESPKLKSLFLGYSNLSKLDLRLTSQLETLHLEECYNLVEVNMPIESPKLKSLFLSYSKLSKLDLRLTSHLETLHLVECKKLVELNIPIESPKLKSLLLSGSKLSKLDLRLTSQLEILHLKECNDLVELHMPIGSPKLKSLLLSGSKLSNHDLRLTSQLETLHLEECNDHVELHMPVECPKLNSLVLISLTWDLNGSRLSKLDLGLTPQLETLDLGGCNDLVELHMPVECPNLKSLILRGSKLSKLDLGLTPQLKILDLQECNNLVELYMPVESPKLKSLLLSGSKLSKLDLGQTPQLKTLNLGGCKDLVELHMPIKCFKLKHLVISDSKLSRLNLGLTPQLETLDLEKCYYLQEIQAPAGCLEKLVSFKLSGCSRFERFGATDWYALPRSDSLATLELIAESLDKCPLHPNNNFPKFQFKCFIEEPLPSSSGNLEKLLSFGLCACTSLESFSSNICGLRRLGKLILEGSIPEVPKYVSQLESLHELILSMKEIKHLPDRICMLKHLKYLQLKSCWLLEQLPMDICNLECLEMLILSDCISLREIPNNICKMKCLEYLHIPYCILVDKLPEELGRLECLRELNIEGAGISRLPQSIYQLKGLRIIGSRWRLESYGFTSLSTVSSNKSCCYVKL